MNIRREFKYLGVIRASPCDYVQRYGNSLVPSQQLPSVVDEFTTPEGLVLAAQHRPNELHELCGDVEALTLIDLEAEGLGGYRQYVERLLAERGRSTSRTSISKSASAGFVAQANRPASKQKVCIVDTPTHQYHYAQPESSLTADSSLVDQPSTQTVSNSLSSSH